MSVDDVCTWAVLKAEGRLLCQEVIPQARIWNTKLERCQKELESGISDIAQSRKKDLTCRGCLENSQKLTEEEETANLESGNILNQKV